MYIISHITEYQKIASTLHNILYYVIHRKSRSESRSSSFSALGERPKLFAAGYSMGAIILANYCGQYKEPLLDGAIHFSGCHDAAPSSFQSKMVFVFVLKP